MASVFSGWVFVIKDAGQGTETNASSQVLPRFMALAQQTLMMYRSDPHTEPSQEPTFSGLVQKATVVELLGRRVLPQGPVLHVFSVVSGSTSLQAPPRGIEIGCTSSEAAHQWVTALEAAAASAPDTMSLNTTAGIAKAQETPRFVPLTQNTAQAHPTSSTGRSMAAEEEEEDAVDNIVWRLIKLSNGLRYFEGKMKNPEAAEGPWLLKAEGIVEAEPDRIFEMIMDISEESRNQWDMHTCDAKRLVVVDGFTDVCRFSLSGAASRKGSRVPSQLELTLRRTWTRNGDGSYVISLSPPDTQLNTLADPTPRYEQAVSTWDIIPLTGQGMRGSNSSRAATGVMSPYYARSLVRFVVQKMPIQGPIISGSTPLPSQRFLQRHNITLPFFKSSNDEKDKKSAKEKEKEKERSASASSLSSVGINLFQSAPVDPAANLEEFADGAPFAAMSRIAGLREYFAALPPPMDQALQGRNSVGFDGAWDGASSAGLMLSIQSAATAANATGHVAVVGGEEFFDAMESSVKEEGDSKKREMAQRRWNRVKWLIRFGLLFQSMTDSNDKEATGLSWAVQRELLHHVSPCDIKTLSSKLDPLGSVTKFPSPDDTQGLVNGWRDPGGESFTVRGPTYLEDRMKIAAGDPLLKLVAMDWFTDTARMDNIAGRPGCLTQSEAGKKLPFIFVVNLQVPGPPFYSLVAYFAAERPIRGQPQSLLHRFKSSTDDDFRNSRFKLIPRISEGHWMVKRAVGTKACILGKALRCSYFKGSNYLEMDCDIGSSSVARNVIGLVISYVTTLVVDLTFLIEAQEADELPEYLLGAFTCIRLDTKKAIPPPSAEVVTAEEKEGQAVE